MKPNEETSAMKRFDKTAHLKWIFGIMESTRVFVLQNTFGPRLRTCSMGRIHAKILRASKTNCSTAIQDYNSQTMHCVPYPLRIDNCYYYTLLLLSLF